MMWCSLASFLVTVSSFKVSFGTCQESLLPKNSSFNYELGGFCPVQISCIEAEIRNLKENLHMKIF